MPLHDHGAHDAPLEIQPFSRRIQESGLFPLTSTAIDVLQINLGRQCNLSCKHCHLEAGPHRTETMSLPVLERCLDIARNPAVSVIDLTGGAPEMNLNLSWFIGEAAKLGKRLIVRSNLVILLHERYQSFIDLYMRNNVEIVGSLPDLHDSKTDRQRGYGVFAKAISVMRRLNERGYGMDGSNLVLDLVHNPVGAILPGSQKSLEQEYKRHLWVSHGIRFNNLFCLTNCPAGRFLTFLIQSGNYEEYMVSLVNAYNRATVSNVMCRSTLSVGWDGTLYDCDFNQSLGLSINHGAPGHVDCFDVDLLRKRKIVIGNHCYACTAGAGSSCLGAVNS